MVRLPPHTFRGHEAALMKSDPHEKVPAHADSAIAAAFNTTRRALAGAKTAREKPSETYELMKAGPKMFRSSRDARLCRLSSGCK
jgi:hypothetical protein